MLLRGKFDPLVAATDETAQQHCADLYREHVLRVAYNEPDDRDHGELLPVNVAVSEALMAAAILERICESESKGRQMARRSTRRS